MAEVPQPVVDYLAQRKTATLATASTSGTPHASTFMYVNDGLTIYFWARPSSTTAEHVAQNPYVSFAIDEYVEDWNQAKGVQGTGDCVGVTAGQEIVQVIGLFADKYPSPTSGASTTSITFFKISPYELQFIDNTGENIRLGEDEFGIDFHRERVLSRGDDPER